ncbi:response regulator transcription factor [Tengunoibacter tsumagoiensis]|nr:response regulator [Tengunoibacter tsumagoiensis]
MNSSLRQGGEGLSVPNTMNNNTAPGTSLRGIPSLFQENVAVSTFFPHQQMPNVVQSILIIEDDASLASLEGEVLAAHGYLVRTVPSGEMALITLEQLLPDLVVLDLELSGPMSGWDVLEHLRDATCIPVLITSSSATAVRKHLRSCGESKETLDHLPKPYPLQTLLKRIKRMLTTPPSEQCS